MHPGCGTQLAFKLLWHDANLTSPKGEQSAKTSGQQAAGNKSPSPAGASSSKKLWFTSPSTARHFLEAANLPRVANPAAAAEGGFAFADDHTTADVFASLNKAKNLLYVCVNTSGKPRFAKQMGIRGYAATASLSNIDDLLAKVQKASAMQGMRFIEILSPCPTEWLSDTSNTVEICRQAVEIGLWPIYEMEHGKFKVNYKPVKLAKPDTFLTLQKKLAPDPALLDKSWRTNLLGKPFEAEI
jgi:hypothetical protein